MTSLKTDSNQENQKKYYNYVIETYSGNIGAVKGVGYTGEVDKAINTAVDSFHDIVNNKKGVNYLKGDLAEVWHVGTANIKATVEKGKAKEYFIAPRDPSVIDIKGTDALDYLKYQVKYYQSAEKTTKAISHPKYFGLPKIVPSDQLEDVKKIAEKLYLRNLHTRPDVAKNYLDTAQRVSDRIVAGNIVSKGAAEQELKQMVPELKNDTFSETKYGLTLNEYIEWSNIAKQAGRAAMTAALINAALKIAPDIINFVKKVLNDEKISSDDIKRLGSNVIEGSVEGALRGGIAAFFTIASRSGMLGQAYVNINPSIIGAATVVTINSIKNAFMLYSKKITPYEFADRCIQDSLIISLSTVGLILGQKYIPIPYLGAMIGSMVGTSLATMVSKGTKSFIMKPLMLSGFTFFGLVKQDYTLPDKVLDELGIETVDIEYIDIEYIDEEYVDIENIDIEYVDMEKLEFTMLERGFIKANVVGYIEK